nr:Chain C, Spike protein S2' peptide [Severe acute respiratory syndrome coronavirus 2]
RLNEVANNL